MKILVVRFSSIGDIVLTTPVVRCLNLQLNAEVHYLTKAIYPPVLEGNPYIHKLFTIRKDIHEVLPELKQQGYDYIADLHHNLRTFRLKQRLNITSGSFPKLNFEKWLLTTFKINKLPQKHIVDRYFQAIKPLNIENDGKGLDYFIPPNEEIDPHDVHPQAAYDNYIALVIGGKYQTKKMPPTRIIALCNLISKPVILLGGEEDVDAGHRIFAKTGSHVVSACGQLSLHGSASIIRQAQSVITHDTGMMHIAAALHKRIVSIWGNTIPAFGMTPYFGRAEDKNYTVEVPGLSCRPCSKLGYDKCPKTHFRCMLEIDLQKIIDNL